MNAWLTTLAASALFHGLLVLFGAPLAWFVFLVIRTCHDVKTTSIRVGMRLAPIASHFCFLL